MTEATVDGAAMQEAAAFTLTWHGPIAATEIDTAAPAMDALAKPGVYLCLQRYPAASRVRAYAGVTKDFRLRLREHIAATLGLTYDIADETGRVVFRHTHVDSVFEAARSVDTLHPLAAEEVKRMRWFCALDDSDPYIPWALIEGLLIRRLKALGQGGAQSADGDIIECINTRGGPVPPGPVILYNEGAEGALDIFGPAIAWPLEDAA